MEKIFEAVMLEVFHQNGFYIQNNSTVLHLESEHLNKLSVTEDTILWLSTSGWSDRFYLDYSVWSKFNHLKISNTGYETYTSKINYIPADLLKHCYRHVESVSNPSNLAKNYIKINLDTPFSIFDFKSLDKNQFYNSQLEFSTISLGYDSPISIEQFTHWFKTVFIVEFSLNNIEILKALDIMLDMTFSITDWAIANSSLSKTLKILELTSYVGQWSDMTDQLITVVNVFNSKQVPGWLLKVKKGTL